MVCILTDPNYSGSIWCKSFFNNLIENLRKNRIPFCEAFDEIPENVEAVFIIASDYVWIKNTIKSLNKVDISPILICNHIEEIVGCEYSCVSSNVQASIKSFLSQLTLSDKNKIAIYGVNTNSVADIGKVDVLFSNKEYFSENIKVFNNNGNLNDCYIDFTKNIDDIDVVICTNYFAAISLVKHLECESPEKLKKLNIFSLTSSSLSKYYNTYITSVNIDYNQYGRAAIRIYKNLKKHSYISTMNITVAWNVSDKHFSNASAVPLQKTFKQDIFYNDNELNEMMKVEKLLDICDYMDTSIITGLIQKLSIEKICEICFMTEGAIKYRIKKLLSQCNIKDKSELFYLLTKYINNRSEF